MKATFLGADVPLTKTFFMQDGKIEKIGHPRILNYTSYEAEFDTIEQLYELLQEHSKKGHCFLKGNLARPLVRESRAGTTSPNESTRILLLDIDGIKGVNEVGEVLTHLKLGNTKHIVQYSSSMGVLPDRGISAHVFMALSKDNTPAILKQYLMQWNLTTPLLRENLGLTRTYNALRWSLDVTTCQNDKLIYIAPPLLKDGVKDSFEGKRIVLVNKGNDSLTLPEPFPNAEANQTKQDEALTELRQAMGLKPRPRAQMKISDNVEYMARPDRATVTGVRVKDEWTHLNLNGGDSWGYYHPTGDPRFIYNFKNEPTYKTSELVPDYWSAVRDQVNEIKATPEGKIYLAFRDFNTSTYYNGIYDENKKELSLAVAKSATQLIDFLKQYDQPVGEYVPDWTLQFRPQSDLVVDVENKVLNTFRPTKFMLMKHKPVTQVPPVVAKLIKHMLGGDDACNEHFLNWLAVIFQRRMRTLTAWVMHGIPGTGKGMFLDKVLRPLLGVHNVLTKRIREIDSQFNGYMEQALVLWIDEAEQSDMGKGKSSLMNADIKNFITEPRISIRKMHTLPYEVENFLNWILVSNKGHIIEVDPEDRRFNVAVFQSKRLEITDAEIRRLDDELPEFYHYLMTRKADRAVARTAMNNVEKSHMIARSRTAIDTVADAINTGNLSFFVEQLPQSDIEALPRYRQELAREYARIVKEMPGHTSLLREELHTLVRYTVDDNVAESSVKFGQYCRHHNLDIRPVSREGKTYRGIPVKWRKE